MLIYGALLAAAAMATLPLRAVQLALPVWGALALVAVNDVRIGELIGANLTAAQKLAVIACWVAGLVFVGYRRASGAVGLAVAWLLLLLLSATLATPIGATGLSESIRSWIGYVFPLLAFFVAWDRIGTERVARAVVAAPWVSIAAGLVMQVLGAGPLLRPEYTGVVRLQGGVVPAHLGMLGFVATVASCWLMSRGTPRAMLWGCASLLVCLASGTRGASAAALLVLVLTLFRSRASVGSRFLLLLGGAAATAIYLPLLMQRSGQVGGHAFNASGRFEAWELWTRHGEPYPWFGRGIGASARLTEHVSTTGVDEAFVVPHNMYLQLWVDLGWIGCGVLVVGLLVWWRRLRSTVEQDARPLLRATGLAFLLYSLVDNTLVTPQLTVPLAMLLASMSRHQHEVRHGGGVVGAGDGLRGRKVAEAAHGR